MGAIAFVTFDNFYCSNWARKIQPGREQAGGTFGVGRGSAPGAGRSGPLVVLRDRVVLDSSAEARQAGIRPGMTVAEARYAARGLSIPPVYVEYDRRAFEECARPYLDVCAEYASAVEAVDAHCAFLDLGVLAGARDVAFPLAADLYRAAKICPRIGIARSKLVARIAARIARGDAEVVPEGDDGAYIAPLPIEKLWMCSEEILQRLRHLGYRTIGEVAVLDVRLLQKQFGDDGFRVWQLARGIDGSPVVSNYPPEVISARFYFPQSAKTDSALEAAISDLARRLSERLLESCKQATDVEMIIALDEGATRVVRRAFTRPMRSFGSLLTGLRLTLRQTHLDSEICSIQANLYGIGPIDTQQISMQRTLEHDENVRLAENTLQKLQRVFGDEAISRADRIAVERRDLYLRAWKEATGWGG